MSIYVIINGKKNRGILCSWCACMVVGVGREDFIGGGPLQAASDGGCDEEWDGWSRSDGAERYGGNGRPFPLLLQKQPQMVMHRSCYTWA
jgi:hypothetical protein